MPHEKKNISNNNIRAANQLVNFSNKLQSKSNKNKYKKKKKFKLFELILFSIHVISILRYESLELSNLKYNVNVDYSHARVHGSHTN